MGNSEDTLELQSSDFEDDRYSRLRLIPWWNQERLKNATIMVVGAGAIGNELIKNLTLLGIGRILIYDMDAIESTNLTRSVLYRAKDIERYKAEVAAELAPVLPSAAGQGPDKPPDNLEGLATEELASALRRAAI